MSQSITNEKREVWINTSTTSTATYKRFGEGINSFNPSNNAQIGTKHYINAKFSSSRRNGLQKQYAFSGDLITDDACQTYLIGLSEKTGNDVLTDMIIFDHVGTGTSYPAKKYHIMVDISNDGGIAGGEDVTIDGTFHVTGDPISGSVTIGSDGTPTFTAST